MSTSNSLLTTVFRHVRHLESSIDSLSLWCHHPSLLGVVPHCGIRRRRLGLKTGISSAHSPPLSVSSPLVSFPSMSPYCSPLPRWFTSHVLPAIYRLFAAVLFLVVVRFCLSSSSVSICVTARRLYDSSLSLNEVVYQAEPSLLFLGSPSIVQLPSGRLLCSNDYFGSGYTGAARNTSVRFSDDGGVNWTFLSWIEHSYWATLMVLDGTVYALGTDSDYNGNVVLHRSLDGGHFWTFNGSSAGVVVIHGSFATGPTPIVLADGVLYKAVEMWPPPFRWPQGFQAAMLSCNLTALASADGIMAPAAWRITPGLSFDLAWIPKSWPTLTAPGFLEGNAVILPPLSSAAFDSVPPSSLLARVVNVLRFNSDPLSNWAIILEYNPSNHTLSFLSLIELPGGMSKFTIRYHRPTASYYTVSNPVPANSTTTYQRNNLIMFASTDTVGLTEWMEVSRVAWDDTGLTPADSIRYTGFQYVDWQWETVRERGSCVEWDCEEVDDRPAVLLAIRTSYRGANSYHNSNRITFKRIDNVTTRGQRRKRNGRIEAGVN